MPHSAPYRRRAGEDLYRDAIEHCPTVPHCAPYITPHHHPIVPHCAPHITTPLCPIESRCAPLSAMESRCAHSAPYRRRVGEDFYRDAIEHCPTVPHTSPHITTPLRPIVPH